jgi:hypothetical protein
MRAAGRRRRSSAYFDARLDQQRRAAEVEWRRNAWLGCAAITLACSNARAAESGPPPLRGLEPFFVSASTILVGEVHGSAEIPQLLWSMACS